MATDSHAQLHRRDAIVRILRQTAVGRQAELVDLLRREGFDATQSSVSRDLRELGVLKGADRYLLPAVEDALTPSHFEDVQTFVKGYRAAGANLTVLRTTTGTAQGVAIALDKARWPEIVGAANASYSHPARIERNQLIVLAAHSVVRNELFLHRQSILEKLKKLPGCADIKGLALRAG